MKVKEKGEFFARLTKTMDATRKNKRYGRDSVAYERRWASALYHDCTARIDRTFRIDENYAFLVSIPKWREIMATSFSGRMGDHELCDVLEEYIEQELHPRTYNNRKEMGSQAAINRVIEDIFEVTEGFTRKARIIKWDLKGFFPNARRDYIEQCFIRLIERHRAEIERDHGWWYADYLRWLTMICVQTVVTDHCELRTPRHYWQNIPAGKSLFGKPNGIGTPIGRLPSQKGMGLYVNDEVRWLNDDCGIRATLFMDDCVMVVSEERHAYALSLLPELRKRLRAKGVRMNERKFYDQPATHGLEFLGTHIRPNRLHLNNVTYGRAIGKIRLLNAVEDKLAHLQRFIDIMNSCMALLKARTDHHRLISLIQEADTAWWQCCHLDNRRKCIVATEGYRHNDYLQRRYNLPPRTRKPRPTKKTPLPILAA